MRPLRPKKAKPAIYTFSNDDLVAWQRAPRGEFQEASWGWVDIHELAEIVGFRPEHLLYFFFEIGNGKIFHPYHKQIRRPELGPSLAFATNFYTADMSNLYEIMYISKIALLDDDAFLKEFLAKDIFVPAGWALAVIKQVKTLDELTKKEREERKNA